MNKVKINKKSLLKTVVENRVSHKKIVDEAMKGYQEVVLDALAKRNIDVHNGTNVHLRFDHNEPENHLKEYDRIIRMLNMSSDKIVELSSQEFDWYVMDNWHWKNQWIHSNAVYSQSAHAMSVTTSASSDD